MNFGKCREDSWKSFPFTSKKKEVALGGLFNTVVNTTVGSNHLQTNRGATCWNRLPKNPKDVVDCKMLREDFLMVFCLKYF